MKKVSHPNCIKMHEVFDEKTKMYIVLELVNGGMCVRVCGVCMCVHVCGVCMWL